MDNSTSSTYGYDALNRCRSISHALVGTTRTFGYGYDVVGNRDWAKRDGNLGDVYDYDLNDQAITTKLEVPNPDTTAPGPQTIVYDANGNRTSFNPYGTPETYAPVNGLNQYTTRNGTSAAYDANGNMTTGFDGSIYTYDAQNRLLTAKTPTGPLVTFQYDGLNRQISKKIGSQALYYRVYDGWDLLGEYKTGVTNAIFAYLYGAGGIVKNVVTNYYYYQDASGSTSHVANGSGILKEYYRYDLHGQPLFFNAAGNHLSDTAIGVRHLFTGQQWYNELGLYDLRNRYYSPDIGRFLQSDPIGFGGDATNLYRYCQNNPLMLSDPSGLGVIFEVGRIVITGSTPGEDSSNGRYVDHFGDNFGLDFPSVAPGGLTGEPPFDPNNPFPQSPFTIQTGVLHLAQAPLLPAVNPTTPYDPGFSATDSGLTAFYGISFSLIGGSGYTLSLGLYVSPQGEGLFASPGVGVGQDQSISATAGVQTGGIAQFTQQSITISGGLGKIGPSIQLPINSGYGLNIGPSTTPFTGSIVITPRTYVTPPVPVDHSLDAWWTMGGRRMPW